MVWKGFHLGCDYYGAVKNRILCISHFQHGINQQNEQPGDPSASLLLTSVRRQSFAILGIDISFIEQKQTLQDLWNGIRFALPMLCTFRRRLALFLPSSSRAYMHGSLQRFPHKNKIYFKCQRIKQGPLQGQAVFQSQDAGDHHNINGNMSTLSRTGDHDRLCQAYTQHPAF